MPTSLVSTGVQFPDNSIQTTAASAGGMTLIGTGNINANLTFTSIPSYKMIVIICSNAYTNGGWNFGYSTNNGSSYTDTGTISGMNNSFPTSVVCTMYNTNITATKFVTYVGAFGTGTETRSNYVSAGVVNAIRLNFGGFLGGGLVYVYGVN